MATTQSREKSQQELGIDESKSSDSNHFHEDVEKQDEASQTPSNDIVGAPLEPKRSRLGTILSKTASAISASKEIGPPPDGGTVAWTQVLMGHLVIFCTWGYISSFGVFQTYYTEALSRPPSDISWVGSIQIWLLFFIGTVSGRATDAGLFRSVFIAGAILQCLGLFMTSLCTEYWQVVLAQGICTGLGNGLQFCPTIALVSTYFAKRRGIGLGLVASGSATGGLVYPIIVQQLLPKIGFAWTMRVLGFVSLALLMVAGTFLKTRLPPRKAGPLVEWGAFKEPPFVLYSLGTFLCFWSLYFAFYYVGSFGRDIIGVDYHESISLLLVMNGVGLPGRLIPNHLADIKFGPINSITPYAFFAGSMFFGWSGVHTRSGLYAFAAVYGIVAAGIQSLFPVGMASLTDDLKKQGTRLGMGFTIVSIAALTGPPLAGALIQSDDGGYLDAQMWAGSMMFCGGFALIGARISKTGWKLRAKV